MKIIKPTYKHCKKCKYRVINKIQPIKYALIMRFYKTKCIICGTRKTLELCHVIPKSVILCNSFFNLIPMCKQHHKEILHGE